jgi:uncharacterized protein with ParB-like and HNH nuclease domain
MASGTTSLTTLFNDCSSLEVPDFQRNYSWGDDQIDEFHRDLKYCTEHKKDHFLGATILMKSNPENVEDKSYQIIDGQQRLTTIFLFVAIIRDLVFDLNVKEIKPEGGKGISVNVISKAHEILYSDEVKGETRFKSNQILAEIFEERIFPEPSADRPEIKKKEKYWSLELRKAYFRIKSLLEKDLQGRTQEEQLSYLWELLNTFRIRFQILRITTESYPESFDIFMTLNNRGLVLGPSDLVKSLFMKCVAQGLPHGEVIKSNELVASQWKEVTDNIGDGDVDQFLRHYLVGKQEEHVRSKDIYTIIDRMVDAKNANSKELSKSLIKEIKRLSQVYAALLNPNSIEDPQIRSACTTLYQLSDTYRVLMMFALDVESPLDIDSKRKIAKLCELVSVRWVLTGENAQELEDHFQKICKMLREKKTFGEIKTKILEKLPSDEKCKSQFDFEISKAPLVRTVLYKINSILGDTGGLLSKEPSKMHIEHIAPRSQNTEWKVALYPNHVADVSAEYASLVEQWGNKTILESPINESVGANLFEVKCEGVPGSNFKGYSHSTIKITRDLTKEVAWNIDIIKLRNKWVQDCFLKIWSPSPAENELMDFESWKSIQPK